MHNDIISKCNYLMVGLAVGTAVGILFAPKSDEKLREYLADKAQEGRKYARRDARELRQRAEDLVERGKQAAARQNQSISAAFVAAQEAYRCEKSKAQHA